MILVPSEKEFQLQTNTDDRQLNKDFAASNEILHAASGGSDVIIAGSAKEC